MPPSSILLLILPFLGTVMSQASYPPVNIEDLTPMTINWNQVHALVRENLLELEDIRKDHESIYKELQGCFGLEACLAEFNLLNANVETQRINLGAGSLLGEIQRLQREREHLEGNNVQLEAEMRERQRQIEWQQRQRQQSQSQSSGRSQSNSYNYGSTYENANNQRVGTSDQWNRQESRGQSNAWGRGGQQNQGGGSSSRSYSYSYEYSSSSNADLNKFANMPPPPPPPPPHGASGYSSSYEYERSYNRNYGGDYDRNGQSRGYDPDDGPMPGRG